MNKNLNFSLEELKEIPNIGPKTIKKAKKYKEDKLLKKKERDVKLKADKLETNVIHNKDNIKGLRELVPNESIDLTVTSPPYGNLREYNGFDFAFKPLAKELYRVTKKGGVVVWIVADQTINGSETGESFKQALYFKEIGFNLHDTMIYQTDKLPLNDKRYEPAFEYMFIFSKGKPKTFNPIKIKSKYAGENCNNKTQRNQKGETIPLTNSNGKIKKYKVKTNVWFCPSGYNKTTKDNFAFEHPAMFPEKLAKDHIKSWSNQKEVVLDPFMGSGTVAKMAKKLNRKYVGFEISQKYIEIAYKRIKKTQANS